MSETIRSFLAVEIPEFIKFKLAEFVFALRQQTIKTKWSREENIHLTLKFLGNQPSERIDALIPALIRGNPPIQPFHLKTAEFGAFPGKHRPRVFWLGMAATPQKALSDLRNRIETSLEPLGFEKETKPFRPHLTLGRSKIPENFSPLWKYVEQHPFPSFSFEVKRFVLMRSILKPSGAEYRTIQKFSLQK